MKLTKLNKKVFAILVIPLISFAGGCNNKIDIGKAKKFGAVAKQYETQYENIVKDIYQSCLRAARYKTPSPGDDVSLTRTKAEQDCLKFGYLEPTLLQYHQLLAEYTVAIRTLSSDELISQLDGAGKLTDSILGLPIPIPGFEDGANILKPIVRRLANSIEKAIQNQYRTEVLEESIKEINEDVQLFIVTLAKITDQIYSQRLFLEVSNMNAYYQAPIEGRSLDSDCKESPTNNCFLRLNANLTALLVDKQWKGELESIQLNQKLSKVHAYLITMKEMANLHQELYNSLP
jgi:hypothetical protein